MLQKALQLLLFRLNFWLNVYCLYLIQKIEEVVFTKEVAIGFITRDQDVEAEFIHARNVYAVSVWKFEIIRLDERVIENADILIVL